MILFTYTCFEVFHYQLRLLNITEWYSRSEKKVVNYKFAHRIDKVSITSALRTPSPKLHKFYLPHLHNSWHVFTCSISATAKHKEIFFKIILTIHQSYFFSCAETFCFIVTLTIYCASPHHPPFLLVFFQPFLRSERKNKCRGFHSNLTAFLKSPFVEVLYLPWKCNYKATTPLPLY